MTCDDGVVNAGRTARRRVSAAVAGLAVAAALSGAVAAQSRDDVLARVGGEQITVAYLRQAEEMQGRMGQGQADRELLLRHLAERKLVAIIGKERSDAEEANAVRENLAIDESAYLAETYHATEVLGAAPQVTEQELAASYRPAMRYDATRYQFSDAEAAERFRRDGDPGKATATELHREQAGSRELPHELAAALSEVKPGELTQTMRLGRSFWVLRLNAANPPLPAEDAVAREALRTELNSARVGARRDEIVQELKKRYSFTEQAVLAEALRSRQNAAALGADRELASFDGGKITVGEYLAALGMHEKKTMHGAMSAQTLERVYRQHVEQLLFARAARQAGLDKAAEFAAYRDLMADLRWASLFAERIRRDAAAAVTAEELKSYFDAHRADHPGEFEQERAAVERRVVTARMATATAEALAEGRKQHPVSYTSGH